MTLAGYWGQLRAQGFANAQRVTEITCTNKGKGGDVVDVRRSEDFTLDQREAALQLIAAIHLGTQHSAVAQAQKFNASVGL